MTREEILGRCDHTLLAQQATWADIRELMDDAIRFRCASVCIPPCYVKEAAMYARERMKDEDGWKIPICTVIGFPNGYQTTETKLFEAQEALKNGADELDMVINIGRLRAGEIGAVQSEIAMMRKVCGTAVLKVIIETCLLTETEKKQMCEVVKEAGADFIKTSTGFSTGGATLEDVKLMKEAIGKSVRIKASGGISDLETAEAFLEAGADRLGTSRVVRAMKAAEEGK